MVIQNYPLGFLNIPQTPSSTVEPVKVSEQPVEPTRKENPQLIALNKEIRSTERAIKSAQSDATREYLTSHLKSLQEARSNLIEKGLAYTLKYPEPTNVPKSTNISEATKISGEGLLEYTNPQGGVSYITPSALEAMRRQPVFIEGKGYSVAPSLQQGFIKQVGDLNVNSSTRSSSGGFVSSVGVGMGGIGNIPQSEVVFYAPRQVNQKETVSLQSNIPLSINIPKSPRGTIDVIRTGEFKVQQNPFLSRAELSLTELEAKGNPLNVPIVLVGSTVIQGSKRVTEMFKGFGELFNPAVPVGEKVKAVTAPQNVIGGLVAVVNPQAGFYIMSAPNVVESVTQFVINPTVSSLGRFGGEFVGVEAQRKSFDIIPKAKEAFNEVRRSGYDFTRFPTLEDVYRTNPNYRYAFEYEPKALEFGGYPIKGVVIDITATNPERGIVPYSKPQGFKVYSTGEPTQGIKIIPKTAIGTSYNVPLQLSKDSSFVDLESVYQNLKVGNVKDVIGYVGKPTGGLSFAQAQQERTLFGANLIRVPRFDFLGNPIPYNVAVIPVSNVQVSIPEKEFFKFLRRNKGEPFVSEQRYLVEQRKVSEEQRLTAERQALRTEQFKEKLNLVNVPRTDTLGNPVIYPTKNVFEVNKEIVQIPAKAYYKYLRRTSDIFYKPEPKPTEVNIKAKSSEEFVTVDKYDLLGNKIPYGASSEQSLNEALIKIPLEDYNRYLRRTKGNLLTTTESEKALKSKIEIESKLSIERAKLREEQLKEKQVLTYAPKYDLLGNVEPYPTTKIYDVNKLTVQLPQKVYTKYLRRLKSIRSEPFEGYGSPLISGVIEVKLESTSKPIKTIKYISEQSKTKPIVKEPSTTSKEGTVQILEKPKQEEISKPRLRKRFKPINEEPIESLNIASSQQQGNLVNYEEQPIGKTLGARINEYDLRQDLKQNLLIEKKSINVVSPILKVETKNINIQETTPTLELQQLSSPKNQQDLFNQPKTAQENKQQLEQFQIISPIVTPALTPISSQVPAQITELTPSQTTELVHITYIPPENKLGLLFKTSPSKKKSKLSVEVRRKGKFKTESVESDLSKAISKGQSLVEKSAAASFRIKSEEGQVLNIPLPSGYQRAKREFGVIVQPRSKRISSFGEKAEITQKGLQAQRLKRGSRLRI